MLLYWLLFARADMAENGEKYMSDADKKPPYSYATLICLAMRANDNRVTLSNIYAWIRENFMYYRKADPAWQVYCVINYYTHTYLN